MAFKEVTRAPFRGKTAAKNTVKVSKRQGSFHVGISGDIFASMGSPSKVKVFVGTGRDFGKIMLKPSEDGYRIFRPRRSVQARMSISASKINLDLPENELVTIKHSLDGDQLILKV